MTVLEIVVAGLCAIVTEGEIDCKYPGPDKETEPFDIVMFDPGWPATHHPRLWVRVDGLPSTPTECWKDNKKEVAADCTSNPDQKWALWELAGKELRVIQEKGKAKLTRGKRKLGGRCWKGKEPKAENCKGPVNECKKDISWLPEYAKAQGRGRIRQELLEHPEQQPSAGGIVRGLVGTLEADPIPGKIWKWQWSHPSCQANVPTYEQRFNHHGRIGDVKSAEDALYLVDLDTGAEEEIAVTGNPVHLWITNMPDEFDLIQAGPNKCVIPHFDHYSAIVESPSSCRRIPYIEIDAGTCEDALGMDDPICPPTIFNRGGG